MPEQINAKFTIINSRSILSLARVEHQNHIVGGADDSPSFEALSNTARVGLCRPKTGPLELKNATRKRPVLNVGALSLIKAGKIQVL
ncbi:Flavin-binding monooxygenase family protein [Perilla frutescens var. hirtella]|nr:Flavin-binding monooxygenase family protein [Perilla frutescens var. frutescens]KAH6792969.1 Flavin-binding monooxygenase family protein [Perilla frutescens var. hirtella]